MTEPNHDTAGDCITPWYTEPWTWLVFGLPLATVLACMLTIAIAISTADGLVVDDYYKRGLEINRVLDREARAEALQLQLRQLRVDAAAYRFTLQGNRTFAPPPRLEIRFTHATRTTADQLSTAEHLGDGHYRGTLGTLTTSGKTLAAGPWYVDAGTAEWRVVKRIIVDSRGHHGVAGQASQP